MHKCFSYKVQDIDESQGIVKVYANAFDNIDSDDDVSLKGSFTKTLKDNLGRMKWFLNHGWSNDHVLLGVPFVDGGIQDDFGLLATNKFNFGGSDKQAKRLARDTFEDYKIYAEYQRTLEHSIGVEPIKIDKIEKNEQGQEIRYVSEWKMWEMSTLTTWGANEKTPMVSLKELNEIPNTIQFFQNMLKGNYSDHRLEKIENVINSLEALYKEPLIFTQQEPKENTLINYEPLLKQINNSKLFKG